MADPHYYTGDDDREFGPDPDEDSCLSCGAHPDEPCTPDCECSYCIGKRAREAVQRIADGPEAA